jgi:hypothetical protein
MRTCIHTTGSQHAMATTYSLIDHASQPAATACRPGGEVPAAQGLEDGVGGGEDGVGDHQAVRDGGDGAHVAGARLRLGIALLNAKNQEKAVQVLRSIRANDGTAEVAKLWTAKA